MGSKKSKCVLKIGGQTILNWTIDTLQKAGFKKVVIVSRNKDKAPSGSSNDSNKIEVIITHDPFFLGAGHALFVGLHKINVDNYSNIFALYGDDSFLYTPDTIKTYLKHFEKSGSSLQLMTTEKEITDTIGGLKRDAVGNPCGFYTQPELVLLKKKTAEIVCGAFIFKANWLKKNIGNIEKSQVSNELILTSLIKYSYSKKRPASVYHLQDENEWCGINTPEELSRAKRLKLKQIHDGKQKKELGLTFTFTTIQKMFELCLTTVK